MTAVRIAITLLALTPAALGQSVVSTHSGVVYFFSGAVFVGGDRLEQKFGKFPDVGEGRELRTETGRAEVLLTPGVILRVAENSSIRMLSNKLSDTCVELLTGSAILESNDTGKDTAVTLIHQNWQVRVPHHAVYRIDAMPRQVRVYTGEAEVSRKGDNQAAVKVKENETLPLAEVLLTERSIAAEGDSFKNWALNRSQVITADNTTAAGIIDDPSQFDSAGMGQGSLTYFPPTGIPALGVTNPYGVSFWSSYQSILGSIYYPPGFYGGVYGYGPGYGYGTVRSGWYTGGSSIPGITHTRPGYPSPVVIPWRTGGGTFSGGVTSPRPTYTPSRATIPHVPPPHITTHPAGHR
jgi:hypothetical protein